MTRHSQLLLLLAACLTSVNFGAATTLQNIRGVDCSNAQFSTFCVQQAFTTDRPIIEIGPPNVALGQFADADVSGHTDFSGIHANLYANGDHNGITGGPTAEAYYSGFIADYLVTTNTARPGDVWDIGFSLNATGNSDHALSVANPYGDDFTTDVSMSIGIPGAVDCPSGGAAGDINGAVSLFCVARLPIQAFAIVPITFFVNSSARSVNGPATLDMSHTALISYVSILDSQGNPDLAAEIFSRSGYDYNAAAEISSPEPTPAILIMLPLLLVLLTRKTSRCLTQQLRY